MHCAASPTRSSIGRLSHSPLQSVWVSLWAWPAVPLLRARREQSGDHPADNRRDDLTASQSPLMLSVLVRAGKGNPASIPTVEIPESQKDHVEEGLGRATGDVKQPGWPEAPGERKKPGLSLYPWNLAQAQHVLPYR